MTISVCGIGWLTKGGYGSIRSGRHHQFLPGEGIQSLVRQSIFSHPFKNFGRLDGISRMTAFAVALALRDAGIGYAPALKQDIGIIGTSSEGSLPSDLAYFKDYVDNGRTLSRGNLFIYTLPSSPLGETAIHFGLIGPLLYATGGEQTLAAIMDMAEVMFSGHETHRMLVGQAGEEEALYFVLARKREDAFLSDLAQAREIVASARDVDVMIDEFSKLKG